MTAEPLVSLTAADRRSPLHGWDDRLAAGSREGVVSLRELPFATQVGLRVPPESELLARCSRALGTDLPLRAGAAAGDERRTVLWLGPDEWLVVDLDREPDAVVDDLRAMVAGVHASVVDLSANRTILELAGPMARDVLEGGCRLDLHPRAFGPGSCASTEVALAAVYLHQVGAERYRLLVRPSFTAYLAEWLLDGMVEHTAGV